MNRNKIAGSKNVWIFVGVLIIFAWLIYLTIEIDRVDSNFNLYTKSISEQNIINYNE